MPVKYFNRHAGQAISRLAKSFPVVLVTGARQTGKTTLFKKSKETKSLPYLSFDDTAELLSAKSDPKTFIAFRKPPSVFDEVQYAQELFPYMKLTVDKVKRHGMYFLTGSQYFHLMKNSSESLAGRIGILTLYGLSRREITRDTWNPPFLPSQEYLAARGTAVKTPKPSTVWEAIFTGSFPAVVSGFTGRDDFYNSYIKTYIERDVRALTQVGDELQFIQFITSAASRTAQMVNYRDMARDSGISEPTAKKWLSILVSSGLVFLLRPYFANISKRLVKTPKLYFLDTGLAVHLTRWTSPEVIMHGAMAGAFFETFVAAEIIKSYANAGREAPIWYYRDKDQKEIDILIEENGALYPIEIKKTAAPNASDAAAFNVLNANKNANKNLHIAAGGLVCTAPSLSIIGKDLFCIPWHYI